MSPESENIKLKHYGWVLELWETQILAWQGPACVAITPRTQKSLTKCTCAWYRQSLTKPYAPLMPGCVFTRRLHMDPGLFNLTFYVSKLCLRG